MLTLWTINPPSIDEIVGDVLSIVRRYMNTAGEFWTAATPVPETGVDSFDFVALTFEIEERYGIDLDARTFNSETSTVRDVAAFVRRAIDAERRAA